MFRLFKSTSSGKALLLSLPHITWIEPNPKGTGILYNSGSTYNVPESFDKMLKLVGHLIVFHLYGTDSQIGINKYHVTGAWADGPVRIHFQNGKYISVTETLEQVHKKLA